MRLRKTKTNRGFKLIEFIDYYNNNCSLQESSLATESAIWLGVNDAKPRILVSDAIKLGLSTKGCITGWIDYDIPEEVSFSTRMHLTQQQVKQLLPTLVKFAYTGEI